MLAHGLNYSTNQLNAMITKVDSNRNGTVDFGEFVDLFLGHEDKRVDVNDEISQAFSLFDHDGDGKINADELMKTMTDLGEEVTEEEVAAMIQEADLDGDGLIDINEFSRLMNSFGK